jgi:hypothetical protein
MSVRAFFDDLLFRCGQVDVEGGAPSLFTVNLDKAAVVLTAA